MNKKFLIQSAVITAIAISLFFLIQEVSSVDGLLGYDPYYHMTLSEVILDTGHIPNELENTVVPVSTSYPTSLQPLLSILSLFTGIQLITLYKCVGPLSLVFLICSMFLLLRRLLQDKSSALLSILLISSFPYLLYRSTMALPETIALSFMLLTVYSLLMKNKALLVVSLLGGFYFHYRSAMLLLILPVLFYLPELFNLLRQCVREKLISRIYMPFLLICSFLILSLPILKRFAFDTIDMVRYQAGSLLWLHLDPNPSLYRPLGFMDYLSEIGWLILLLSLFGIFSIARTQLPRRQGLLIFGWLILTLLLTFSTYLSINIQPYRFLAYLGLPLIIVSSIGVQGILGLGSKLTREFIPLFLLILLASCSIITSANIHGWQGYQTSDLHAKEWVEGINNDNTIILAYSWDMVSLGVNNTEGRFVILDRIRRCTTSRQLDAILGEEYSDKNVYYVVISTTNDLISKYYPDFENLLSNYPLCFKEGKTEIYLLR